MIQSSAVLINSPKVQEYILTIHRDGSRSIVQKGQYIPKHKSSKKCFMSMITNSVVQNIISRRYDIVRTLCMVVIIAMIFSIIGMIPKTENVSPSYGVQDVTKVITVPVPVSQNIPDLKTIPDEVQKSTITADTMELPKTNTSEVSINDYTLISYDLPDKYYPGVDFSSFQAYMCFTTITNRKTPAWKVVRSWNAYTDEYGFRRYKTESDQFTINGEDDYIIALGTYYKEKGTCGDRYLINTTTGSYTAIAGDEKADIHTDARNMISSHGDGQYAGMIEWIVDLRYNKVPKSIRNAGSVTAGPIESMKGEIISIYKIQSI